MIKRTLYFGNPAYLCCRNEQLLIRLPEVENSESIPLAFKKSIERAIPIEDIGVLVLDHQQITISQVLLGKLLENNVACITCNQAHLPTGLMLPLDGNTTQNERFRDQLSSSLPLQKQLWQQTVQAKIRNQAIHLKNARKAEVRNMLKWVDEVRSGDTNNIEARAAAYYWANLFSNFKREREGASPNNLLNYGYAILRAIIARALVGSGLLPTLGIHHHNRYNAYCLADDIMEPYRPYVDRLVVDMYDRGIRELDKETKAKFLAIPVLELNINNQRSPLMIAAGLTTSSLYKCFSGENRKIIYPEM